MRPRVGIGLLVVAAVAAGCGGHQSTSAASASTRGPSATAARSEPVASGCPVTLPRPWVPPAGVSARALFGSDYAAGNGRLWVGGLGQSGVIDARPQKDGTVAMKFGWWRNVRGQLRITGRRLDAAAPPLRADVPGGYGKIGFQSSGVFFPTGGCWQVTGRAGTAALTFVTKVIKQPI